MMHVCPNNFYRLYWQNESIHLIKDPSTEPADYPNQPGSKIYLVLYSPENERITANYRIKMINSYESRT